MLATTSYANDVRVWRRVYILCAYVCTECVRAGVHAPGVGRRRGKLFAIY
jgi:hypothetical protein